MTFFFDDADNARLSSNMALDQAIMQAERSAYHTYFDTHVVAQGNHFDVITEPDYDGISPELIDMICYTAPGQLGIDY